MLKRHNINAHTHTHTHTHTRTHKQNITHKHVQAHVFVVGELNIASELAISHHFSQLFLLVLADQPLLIDFPLQVHQVLVQLQILGTRTIVYVCYKKQAMRWIGTKAEYERTSLNQGCCRALLTDMRRSILTCSNWLIRLMAARVDNKSTKQEVTI